MKRLLIVSFAGIILPGALGAAVSYGLYVYMLDPSQHSQPFSSFVLFTVVGMAITVRQMKAVLLNDMHKNLGFPSVG